MEWGPRHVHPFVNGGPSQLATVTGESWRIDAGFEQSTQKGTHGRQVSISICILKYWDHKIIIQWVVENSCTSWWVVYPSASGFNRPRWCRISSIDSIICIPSKLLGDLRGRTMDPMEDPRQLMRSTSHHTSEFLGLQVMTKPYWLLFYLTIPPQSLKVCSWWFIKTNSSFD